jgi:glutamate-1-semialdehyde 2,1-aminomutase
MTHGNQGGAGASRPGPRSKALFTEARQLIPGGVNSPVRAFAAVGGEPFFTERASGCRLTDVDGNEYIDYIGSWGPMILGHAHPRVTEAVQEAMSRGSSFGTATGPEVELAREICALYPSIERVRLVSSGTEATMSAIRLARGATGRSGIVKCDGCYHGHVDALLVAAGSGAATLGIPGSAGVPESVVQSTHVVPFSDAAAVGALFEEKGNEIACLILEPVCGNMGCVPPAEGYLQEIRALTEKHGVLLILDEVMTGFRVGPGGAQERFGVTPDLTTLGKIVGGGLPVGAYGGRADLMKQVAPEGPVYQAGTLSGNPLAVAAGLTTLQILREEAEAGHDPYARLEESGALLAEGLAGAAQAAGVPHRINRVGAMLTLFFTDRPVTDFSMAKTCDTERFGAFFRGLVQNGVAWPPSQFEAAFVSLAHTPEEIGRTVEAARKALAAL